MKSLGIEAASDSQETDCDPAIQCAECDACCCKLEVMQMGDDDIPARFTVVDQWGGEVMRRLDDLWCAALDRDTMKCRIYEGRPIVCRDFQMGGIDCISERSKPAAQPPDRELDGVIR